MRIEEFLDKYTVPHDQAGKDFVAIRGCGGRGKSTFIYEMMKYDPETFEVTWSPCGKTIVMATCIPNFNFVVLGAYKNRKCGGGDTINAKDYPTKNYNTTADTVFDMINTLKDTKFTILFEGLLASTIYETYKNMFEEVEKLGRKIHVLSMDAPAEVCYQRILGRNGGKEVQFANVERKWGSVHRSHEKFVQNTDFHCVLLDNSKFEKEETLQKYYDALGMTLPENYKDNFGIDLNDDW